MSQNIDRPSCPQTLTIIHLDMDAFFASVEVLDNPELRGQPVIVGGRTNRGVVSAASYAARTYGVCSAMPIVQARRLCPKGVFLPPRMHRYSEISTMVLAIFQRYTPLVEPLSLDEAFLDVKRSQKLFGGTEKIAEEIRSSVLKETGLTVSAGVASSKLIAKIASDQKKPDGLTVVPIGSEKTFLAPLPIRRLWGVGHKTHQKLTMLGVSTIGDLRKIGRDLLIHHFGKSHGLHLYRACNAIDNRPVVPEHDPHSIGNEFTLERDLLNREEIKQKLLALTVRVAERMRREQLVGKTITIKVKYYDFRQRTRSITLPAPTDDGKKIYREACSLLTKTQAGTKALRLIGLAVSHLTDHNGPQQLSLFEKNDTSKEKNLHKAIDTINEKYGERNKIFRNEASRAIAPARLFTDHS